MTIEVLEKCVEEHVRNSNFRVDCDVLEFEIINSLMRTDYEGFVLTYEKKMLHNPDCVYSNCIIYRCDDRGNVEHFKAYAAYGDEKALAQVMFALLCDDIRNLSGVIRYCADLLPDSF